ncbi:MAG: hypothetical protein HYZ09_02430 [Candidatus Kerfeldbacteria bacterium]|nr:hypothetical protein [Candidatus Kerfeldbacteria bacterium]
MYSNEEVEQLILRVDERLLTAGAHTLSGEPKVRGAIRLLQEQYRRSAAAFADDLCRRLLQAAYCERIRQLQSGARQGW